MSSAAMAQPADPDRISPSEAEPEVADDAQPPTDASILHFPHLPSSPDNARRRNGFQRTRTLLWIADGTIAAAGALAALANRPYPLVAVMAVLWLGYMTIQHTRDGRIADLTDLRRVVSINVNFVLFAAAVAIFWGSSEYPGRWAFGVTGAMALLAIGARWALTRPRVRRWFDLSLDERIVVVGDLESVSRTITEWEDIEELNVVGVFVSESDGRPRSVKGVEVLGTVCEVADRIPADVDIVAVHDVDKLGGLQLAKLQWELEELGAQLSVITPVTNTVEARATVRRAGRRLIVDLAHGRPRGALMALKCAFDRCVAGVLLVIALPVVAICALLVKATSPGPAFFKQVRVREHGATFTMYKLRTMTVNAEAMLAELLEQNEVGGGLFKIKLDPRITPVGAWLRRLSLDELPQLWNVVKGDMSLIGPRPALPSEVQTYDDWARRRLAVKPGLTGLWQVSGRSNLSWTDSVRIDSDYVDNWRFGRDLAIAVRTVKAVLTREGAH